MALSAIAKLLEDRRQKITGDSLFWRRLPPIFELRVPASVSLDGATSFLFPLPMPPRSLDISYPFAVEVSPTANAGVVVERNGVITRDIRIAGTMGQRVKPYQGSHFGSIIPKNRRVSTSEVASKTVPNVGISGHRFLLHLRDNIFGLYSELTQDPETAEETRLILHIPKDGLSLVVEPRTVTFPRDAGRSRLSYDYEITLTAIENAKALPPPQEDRGILSQLADAVQQVRAAIRLVSAAIRDLQQIRAELERIARTVANIVADIAAVAEDLAGLVDNSKRSVTTTRDRLEALVDRLDAALFDTATANVVTDDTAQLLLGISDSLHAILAHPELFEPSAQERTEAAFRRGLGLLAERSRAGLTAAAAGPAPASQAALARAGTLPGDLERDTTARALPEDLRVYRSTIEVVLRAGDTLEGLAARYLGDARRWRHIAILNALEDPYITDLGFPNTLGPGDRILIPSTAQVPRRGPNPAVLGARPEDPAEVRELGGDFLVTYDERGGTDWTIDEDGGAVDLRIARGRACVIQDLRTRVETERGTDVMFRALGVERVIGFGIAESEVEAIRLRVAESVEADPRVAQTLDLAVTRALDVLAIDLSVQLRGSRDAVVVQGSTVPPTDA